MIETATVREGCTVASTSHPTLNRVWVLRQLIHPLSPLDAMELLRDRIGKTAKNQDFLDSMSA